MQSFRFVLWTLSVAAALSAGTARADVVADWNKSAVDTVVGAKWPVARRGRVVAITQAAVFDAVDAIERRYKPYVYDGTAPTGASPVAAASQAAFRVLATLVPEQAERLGAKNDEMLASVTDLAARSAGVAVGEAAAHAILQDRQNDGYNDETDPPPTGSGPGDYRPTSPGPMAPNRFTKMRPFGFASSAQFRLPPPPPLDSAQFLRDLAEVRAKGDARAAPSEEHVAIVNFHAPAGIRNWNEIGRMAAEAHGLGVLDAARELALLNFALSDSFEISFESKNAYNFWRPQTAIQSDGAAFGHPEIAADPEWKSIIPAPPFPEYPCMHCAVGSAAARVLETLFPENPAFKVGGAKGRSFPGFQAYADEEAESRILGGVHFRWSLVAGEAQGKWVADEDLKLLAPKL